jgi:peptidoglycan/LPS O-acetylase OafA/YrhL
LSAGFPDSLKEVAHQAEVGVIVFFVISGFLITNLLLAEGAKNGSISISSFYIRRVFRIIPVYILYVVFILLWRNMGIVNVSPSNLQHVSTFTVNFDRNKDWFLGHFWSLSVEEQFYLFWPAIVILFRKHLKIVLLILVAYSCISRVIAYEFPGYAIMSLSPFFNYSDAIFIGAFGGIVFFENPEIFRRKIFGSYMAQLIALSLFLLFVYCAHYGKLPYISFPFGNSIISLSVLFLMCAYILPSDKVMFKLLNHKAVIHVGILSYSIYIWQHCFFIGQIKGFWCTFPYNILVIYVVSLASYYLWEKPFLTIKKHFSVNKLQPGIRSKFVIPFYKATFPKRPHF